MVSISTGPELSGREVNELGGLTPTPSHLSFGWLRGAVLTGVAIGRRIAINALGPSWVETARFEALVLVLATDDVLRESF
jgi:hypothetical protein